MSRMCRHLRWKPHILQAWLCLHGLAAWMVALLGYYSQGECRGS
jgi:hypothetical protein